LQPEPTLPASRNASSRAGSPRVEPTSAAPRVENVRVSLRARVRSLPRGLRRSQQQVQVEARARVMGLVVPGLPMLRTLPRSSNPTDLAVWALSASSRYLLEHVIVPYLMQSAAIRRAAPVARAVWGVGRVVVPAGFRLVARRPLLLR
jgi:hypothetical protein